MLASINSWDPFFFYETHQALLLCNGNNQDVVTRAFIGKVGNQITFQMNLVISGLMELAILSMTLIGMFKIENDALRVAWYLLLAAAFLLVSATAGMVLQDNENILLLQRNASNTVREITTSPLTTTASLLKNWLFRGVEPIDTLAQNLQQGLVHPPKQNSSSEENTKFVAGLTRKWLPISLHTVYDGLMSFAKQKTSFSASVTESRPISSLSR